MRVWYIEKKNEVITEIITTKKNKRKKNKQIK